LHAVRDVPASSWDAVSADYELKGFATTGGAKNALTAWWRSVSADAHANNDIPTEIRLYPAEWGQLLLK